MNHFFVELLWETSLITRHFDSKQAHCKTNEHFGKKQAHCQLLRDTLMTSTQIANKDCLDLQTALELRVTAF